MLVPVTVRCGIANSWAIRPVRMLMVVVVHVRMVVRRRVMRVLMHVTL